MCRKQSMDKYCCMNELVQWVLRFRPKQPAYFIQNHCNLRESNQGLLFPLCHLATWLETFLAVTTMAGGYWHLVNRGQRSCWISSTHRTTTITKSHLPQTAMVPRLRSFALYPIRSCTSRFPASAQKKVPGHPQEISWDLWICLFAFRFCSCLHPLSSETQKVSFISRKVARGLHGVFNAWRGERRGV